MFKTLILFFYSCLFLIFFSCNPKNTNNPSPAKQEKPKALQDNRPESFGRSSDRNDLVEELYAELVSKNYALKVLEDDLNSGGNSVNESKVHFTNYDRKSNNYYSSANSIINSISDSLLKKKIAMIISRSKSRYSDKTKELNSILKDIDQNDATLYDRHTVLKVLLTMPLIEKYQDENIPEQMMFKNLTQEQKKLIARTDSLTPKPRTN